MVTTPGEDIPLYQYEPLPDAATHIRLLTVLALHEDQPIQVHAQLTVWPRASAPPYHAISYTWGDPEDTASVLINTERMIVRRNCEYVLKQARWYDEERRARRRRPGREGGRYIWCDAICIDQGNNEEKGFQVAMMGKIYKRAEGVLACVGEGGEGSELVFAELRRDRGAWLLRAVAALESGQAARARRSYSEVLSRIGGVDLSSKVGSRQTAVSRRLQHWYSALWLRTRQKPTWPRLVQALGALASREYFRRVWIYQELSLGANILICCGKDTAPLHLVYGMLTIIYGPTKRARRLGFTSFDLEQDWDGLGQCEDMVEVGCVSKLDIKRLLEAIYTVSLLKCVDARDRVYGVLSLVQWGPHEAPIFPDYTRDVFEIGVDVLERLGAFHFRIVMKSLELGSSVSEGLLAARARRRHESSLKSPLDHDASAAGVPGNVPGNAAFAHAFGLRLVEGEGRLCFGGSSTSQLGVYIQSWPDYYQKDEEPENEQTRSRILVLVPFETGIGDWCIFHRPQAFTNGWIILMARYFDEKKETLEQSGRGHRFTIEGKGLAFVDRGKEYLDWSEVTRLEKEFTDSLGGLRSWFDVYCGAEDALCLESSFAPNTGIDPAALQLDVLSEYFETEICGQPGSSFAFDICTRGRAQAEKHEAYRTIYSLD